MYVRWIRRLQWQASYFIQRVNSVRRLKVLTKYTRIALLAIMCEHEMEISTQRIYSVCLSSAINDMFEIRFYTKTIDTASVKRKTTTQTTSLYNTFIHMNLC